MATFVLRALCWAPVPTPNIRSPSRSEGASRREGGWLRLAFIYHQKLPPLEGVLEILLLPALRSRLRIHFPPIPHD